MIQRWRRFWDENELDWPKIFDAVFCAGAGYLLMGWRGFGAGAAVLLWMAILGRKP